MSSKLPLVHWVVLWIALTINQVQSHAVEVRQCLTVDGTLRVFVEHWHHDLDNFYEANTMTIRNDTIGEKNGEILNLYASGKINSVDETGLTGCSDELGGAELLSTCNNPYQDWVYFDFETYYNQRVTYTFLKGDTVFLEDGCPSVPLFPVTVSAIRYMNQTDSDDSTSVQPSAHPSMKPSPQPSQEPTLAPSIMPSIVPSMDPSINPSKTPTSTPSTESSLYPSEAPTKKPSMKPSTSPSTKPTNTTSTKPTMKPSTSPSTKPTNTPSTKPTLKPSLDPSSGLSFSPSTSIPSSNPSEYRDFPDVSMVPSETPSSVPSPPPVENDSCKDDEDFTFKTQSVGKRGCDWLSDNTHATQRQEKYCRTKGWDGSSPKKVKYFCQASCVDYVKKCQESTAKPSDLPSDLPSTYPSVSMNPTPVPSELPSLVTAPTDLPTDVPSDVPSDTPSFSPFEPPPSSPSDVPSLSPSIISLPSSKPSSSIEPSDFPSLVPSPSTANDNICKDDNDFSFMTEYVGIRDCKWLSEKQRRIEKYCRINGWDGSSKKKITYYCQASCAEYLNDCRIPSDESARPSTVPSTDAPSHDPSLSPSDEPSITPFHTNTPMLCEEICAVREEPHFFFFLEYGEDSFGNTISKTRTCGWLASKSKFKKDYHCRSSESDGVYKAARDICTTTCCRCPCSTVPSEIPSLGPSISLIPSMIPTDVPSTVPSLLVWEDDKAWSSSPPSHSSTKTKGSKGSKGSKVQGSKGRTLPAT